MDNSPHVMLFAPIIRELRRHGIGLVLTARDFAQTCSLAEQHGLTVTAMGHHYQSHSPLVKATATLQRAWQLRRFIQRYRITAAISHGSRGLVLAARSVGCPVMTLYDYEFASCRLFNMFSRRILAPQVIPEDRLVAQGLNLKKLVRYPGLKEEVYVYDFVPDGGICQELGLDCSKIIITIRPPAAWAHYHQQRGDVLFRALLDRLKRTPNVQVLMPARTKDQELELRHRYELAPEKFSIFTNPVDGLNLMWHSDMIFVGGGTMSREAALLGLNVCSIFGGAIGAADEHLVAQGRLRLLRDPDQIVTVPLEKRQNPLPSLPRGRSLAPFIADEILRFSRESAAASLTG